jgi:hypothetical protein
MSERKQVRITNDGGDFFKTRIVDMETGKTIPMVVSIDWHADNDNDVPLATIKTLLSQIDVETGAEIITVCPECGGEGAIEELLRLRDENRTLKDQVERLARGRTA